MPWWNPFQRRVTTHTQPEQNSVVTNALTAAAAAVKASRSALVTSNARWQTEAWEFYDTLGEFRFAVEWKSEMISRVRLRAGRLVRGQDEPELLDSGPAVALVSELGGGIGGQSEMMATFSTQLSVVGESFLVGVQRGPDDNDWMVRSSDEIRVTNVNGRDAFEVLTDELGREVWEVLPANSLVTRVWRPHRRYHRLADAPTRSMRATMRELELANRKITAQYISRLASAGVFIIPDEVAFPVREEFQDAEDPFVLEWIETAREAIAQPGTASAAIPIPMRVPAEYADKFNFIDFTIKDDDKIIEKRESAIRRLATQVDVPAEILLGMGDVNHWSAWQLEESAIKTHISSDVETIAQSLTVGYLWPRLRAMGEDPTNLVVWYDTSELSLRPDRSQSAVELYDRMEINGAALRRESGFNESDEPDDEELRDMALRKLVSNPQIGFAAIAELTETEEITSVTQQPGEIEPTAPVAEPDDSDDVGARDIPDTRDAPPPTPGVDAVIQASARHRLVVDLETWTLHHPACCRDATFTCPVTQASRFLMYHPGTMGSYECWLSPQGELIVGGRVFDGNTGFIPGHTRQHTRKALSNGHHTDHWS
jgi:hypothetical protein